MKNNDTKEFLINICDATSISGYETEVATMIKEKFEPYCDNVSIDNFGNVIGIKKGSNPKSGKIMFAAHMDEIGLMVSNIDKDGFIKFSAVGGYDGRTLLGQEVYVYGKEKIFGVIGMLPPHLSTLEERETAIDMADMCVDVGFSYEEVSKIVKVGDLICINRQVIELQNQVLSGKSFDDKAGVAVIYEAMKNLKNTNHSFDLYFVATAQEEPGIKGAMVAANIIAPDICIAVDVGFAKMAGLDEFATLAFNGGPAIGIGPNMHYAVYEKLKEVCKDNFIKNQIQVIPMMSYTDAMFIQIAGDGVATGLISIPLKYMHTSVETVSMEDIFLCGKLLSDFVKDSNDLDLEVFLCS